VGASREDIKTLIESRTNLPGMERAARMIWNLDLFLASMSTILNGIGRDYPGVWSANVAGSAVYLATVRGLRETIAILREVGVLRTE
jgi:hypothetical protein